MLPLVENYLRAHPWLGWCAAAYGAGCLIMWPYRLRIRLWAIRSFRRQVSSPGFDPKIRRLLMRNRWLYSAGMRKYWNRRSWHSQLIDALWMLTAVAAAAWIVWATFRR